MKHLVWIFLILPLALLSCENRKETLYLQGLQAIQEMGDSVPSEALDSLHAFNMHITSPTEYASMKASLLGIRLRDKCDIIPTSDDSIKSVYKYFEDKGTINDRAEASYYMASVYRDLDDGPRAVEYFLNSIKLEEQSPCADTILMVKACSQLIYIYGIIYQYKDAQKLADKEYEISLKAKIVDPRTLMDVYTSYIESGDTAKAIKFGRMAESEMIKSKTENDNIDILAELLLDYITANKKADATRCFKILSKVQSNNLPANYYHAMANYYNEYVSSDSGSVYMSMYLNKTSGFHGKMDAAHSLLKYYQSKENEEMVMFYAGLLAQYADSLENSTVLEQTANSKNYFKYQRDKEEEDRLRMEAYEAKLRYIIIILILGLALAGFVALFLYKKKRSLEKLMEAQKETKKAKDIVKEKDKELKAKIAINAQLMKAAHMSTFEGSDKEVISKFTSAAMGKYHLQESDWKDLFTVVDNKYPNFAEKIHARLHNVSEPMLRTCYLVKVGMSNSQIERVTGYPHQTVWSRVKKINETFGGKFLEA